MFASAAVKPVDNKLELSLAKNPAEELYKEKLAKYLKEADEQKFSSLERHVFLFLDKEKSFSPSTVTAELDKMHGSSAWLKGRMIATFNATHGSDNVMLPSCMAKFVPDGKNKYARFLHLGTMRVWEKDGTVNQERLEKATKAVAVDHKECKEKIVSLHKLKEYLGECYKQDKQEKDTGRNTSAFFSSATAQAFAATAAWDEVFDRLACGWVKHGNDLEPYLTESVFRDFFIDSPVAFLKAECGLLPAAKPADLSCHSRAGGNPTLVKS